MNPSAVILLSVFLFVGAKEKKPWAPNVRVSIGSEDYHITRYTVLNVSLGDTIELTCSHWNRSTNIRWKYGTTPLGEGQGSLTISLNVTEDRVHYNFTCRASDPEKTEDEMKDGKNRAFSPNFRLRLKDYTGGQETPVSSNRTTQVPRQIFDFATAMLILYIVIPITGFFIFLGLIFCCMKCCHCGLFRKDRKRTPPKPQITIVRQEKIDEDLI